MRLRGPLRGDPPGAVGDLRASREGEIERADVERESLYRLCRKHGINPTDYRAHKSRG